MAGDVEAGVTEMAAFQGAQAALSASSGEAAASVTRLVKLIEGLNGAVQRARLDGLSDEEIADQLAPLPVAPLAVRAALAADFDGTALRLLVASLIAEPGETSASKRWIPDRVIRVLGWGWPAWR